VHPKYHPNLHVKVYAVQYWKPKPKTGQACFNNY
jgi:hypothetical protein